MTIAAAIALGGLVSLFVYFAVAGACQKLNRKPSDFFYADRNISGPHYGNTYTGANITFTSIFMYLCFQATLSGWTVLWATAFWIVGVVLFVVLAPRLESSFLRGQTIHQYLSDTYGSERLMIVTSIVTVVAFIGTIGLEFLGFSLFLRFFGVSESSTFLIGLGLIAIMAAYCVIGGYWATIKTDVYQVLFTLVGVVLLLHFTGILRFLPVMPADTVSMHLQAVRQTFSGRALFEAPALIIGFAVLFIPFQFSVMDMWERCVAAHARIKRIRYYTLIGGVLLGLVFAIPVVMGVIAREMGYGATSSDQALFACIGQFLSPLVVSLVGVMFLASVFSTADTLLLAATNSLVCDLNVLKHGKALTADEIDSSDVTLTKCRRILIGASAATVSVFAISYFLDISDIIIAVFSAQAILGTLVLIGFSLGGRARTMGRGAVRSAAAGLILPIPLVILGKMLGSPDLVNGAPLVSIIVAVVLLFATGKEEVA